MFESNAVHVGLSSEKHKEGGGGPSPIGLTPAIKYEDEDNSFVKCFDNRLH